MSKKTKTTLGISVFLFVLAIAAVSFAQGPYGGGRGMRDGYGCQYGQRGYEDRAEISDETRTRVEEAREAFYDETRELRDSIREARMTLGEAMRTDNPDEAEVIRMQKDLSSLEAQFDEKAVSHRLAMRQLLPEDYRGRGFGRGFGRGKGGCGQGRGQGRGAGNCWR